MKRLPKHPSVDRLKKIYRSACIVANYMAGIPDHDRYVAQQCKHNLNASAVTRSQSVDYYRTKGNGNGCCCWGRYDNKPRAEQAVWIFCCWIVSVYVSTLPNKRQAYKKHLAADCKMLLLFRRSKQPEGYY